MKRKANVTRKKPTKKMPINQKLLDEFIFGNRAKTEIKINNRKSILEEKILEDSKKNEDELTKPKENVIPNQNSIQSLDENKKIFLIYDKKKFKDNIKNSYLSSFKKDIKEKEMTFPIMVKTKLEINPEFKKEELIKILDKTNSEKDLNWIELMPLIDNPNIIQLKIKDFSNKNNSTILGFIINEIAEKIILLLNNDLFTINIYINKNDLILIIIIGLNYNKSLTKLDFIDENKKIYVLNIKTETYLGKENYKILKELYESYSLPEKNKKELLYLIYNISSKKEKKDLNILNGELNDEDSNDNISENKRGNLSNYLINNVEKILSLTLSYNNLFNEDDKNYYNIFINLNTEEKKFLIKFLRRNNKWQNIDKLISKDENFNSNNDILKNLDKIIFSLLEKKLISNFHEVVGDINKLNYNKLFEYLYYLSNDDLKEINSKLNNICKNLISKKEINEVVLPNNVKECFANNPFYNLNKFISSKDNKNLNFNKIISNISEKITNYNFSQDVIFQIKSKKAIESNQIFGSKKNNLQYIYEDLNYSTFKSIHLTNKFTTGNKIKLIKNIINSIYNYLNEKGSKFMQNFLSQQNTNNNININSKEENIEQIFENYNRIFFCINENFTRIMDITSRLFFFYTDCKDLNDIGKEFFSMEKYELFNYHNEDIENRIFKDKNEFYLYDDLFQIKNSYDIFMMFYDKNEIKCNNFYIEIIEPLIPLLLKEINSELYKKLFKGKFDINLLEEKKIYSLNNILINELINNFDNKNINYNKISFVDKYKTEYISAEILYSYINCLEKNKDFEKAILFYLFLLNCFDNLFILENRGSIYNRIILNYNYHFKDKENAIKIINICIEYEIMKYGIIQSGELVKIKIYYNKFNNQKSKAKTIKTKQKYNSLIDYSFNEIDDNFDFTSISKEIEGERSNISSSTKRIQFKMNDGKFSKTDTVEKYALRYYKNNENLKGVIGENKIIRALYFLLLWEEIFDDEIPLVFQSKYQDAPLDFFEKDFYINRKNKIDQKLEKIKKYKKEELIAHIKTIYQIKKGIKNPCVSWDSFLNSENILIKAGIAFGPEKLVEIFKVILNNGYKYVKRGIPDLFLWKENNIIKFMDYYYAEENSIKLVEVKSAKDKLSNEQKFWIKTFYEKGINVEILYVK